MWHFDRRPVKVRDEKRISHFERGARRMPGRAKPLAHTRPSELWDRLLAEPALPFRLLEVFQYSTHLCESGAHPFPQGLLIL